ncbi:MAG: DUF2867 domain-containing protein [Gemmatimonadota bacterium]
MVQPPCALRVTGSTGPSPSLAPLTVAFAMVSGRRLGSGTRGARNAARPIARTRSYLGGLLPPSASGKAASEHLASRAEVGERLREALPTTEFRAGPIIGSGSASFEMVRYLTERLPAMVTPRWIRNEVQPISIRDILQYLLAGATVDEALGVVEVGADAVTFEEMMQGYARVRGLRRFIFPLPILAPSLAARWVGLVTPIPNRLAVPLVEGVLQPILADRRRAVACFPAIEPMSYHDAVELALRKTEEGAVTTRWSGSSREGPEYRFEDREGLLREIRTRVAPIPPERFFRVFSSLGGEKGWLAWQWAWWARGLLDQLVGGPGLRRGRRHPHELEVGEAVDFWRVESVRPPHLLRLRAEMRVPGRAWLQFEAEPHEQGSRLIQTAIFAPSGLWGVLYWYLLYPVHRRIFSQMVDAVLAEAMSNESN